MGSLYSLPTRYPVLPYVKLPPPYHFPSFLYHYHYFSLFPPHYHFPPSLYHDHHFSISSPLLLSTLPLPQSPLLYFLTTTTFHPSSTTITTLLSSLFLSFHASENFIIARTENISSSYFKYFPLRPTSLIIANSSFLLTHSVFRVPISLLSTAPGLPRTIPYYPSSFPVSIASFPLPSLYV